MSLRTKAKLGDVFQIPLDGARVGYGQVVAQPQKDVLFVCLFAAVSKTEEQPNLQTILRSEILLAGNTFDGKIWHGHWPVVGNVPPSSAIALPKYREGLPGHAFVESFDMTKRRVATIEEESVLPFRTFVAPIRLENALKALLGTGEWLEEYDHMRYELVQRSSKVVI
jgi:hypothetical protein